MPKKGTELAGRTVLVTRAPDQAGALSEALRARGAQVLELPTIRIAPPEDWAPLDQALRGLSHYAMVVVGSRNAIEAVEARAEALDVTLDRPVACVGEKTRAVLLARGRWSGPVLVPPVFRAEALVEAIIAELGGVEGLRFLYPQAPEGRAVVAEGLRARGAQVDQVSAYRIVPADPLPDPSFLAPVDIATFLSGETLAAFLQVVPGAQDWLAARRVAVIGPVAAERAAQLGVRVDLVPRAATVEALVEALAAVPGT